MELRGGRAADRRTGHCLLIMAVWCLALLAGVAAAATPTGLPPADQVSPTVTISPVEPVAPAGEVTTTWTITPTTTITTAPDPQESLPFEGTPNLWAWVFGLIALLLSLPWMVQTGVQYHFRKRAFEKIDKIDDEGKRVDLLKELAGPFPDRKGLTRLTIMIGVILIVGAVLLYLAVTNPAGELFQTALAVLTGAFSTIIGFYFGGATAETKSKNEAEATARQTAEISEANVAIAETLTTNVADAVVKGVAEGKRPP